MTRSVMILTVAIAAALAVPFGAATWRSVGSFEPDTVYDRTEGRMFLDPPTNATQHSLYFNGYTVSGTFVAGQPTTNPNSGTLGTRIVPPAGQSHRALLGVWRDCNRDGYIGLAETAVRDYLEALDEHDPALCPIAPRVDGELIPPHNDGTWIKEFFAIGMVDPCQYEHDSAYRTQYCTDIRYGTSPAKFTKNPDVIYANDTFVWIDFGFPGSIPGNTCPLRPQPEGTTSGTGAVLRVVDCSLQRRVANTVNGLDPNDELGLKFDDVNNPQKSDSRLNQHFPVNLFGNPYNKKTGLLQQYNPADDRYAYEPAVSFNCAGTSRTDVRDPTAPAGSNGTLNQIGVKAQTLRSAGVPVPTAAETPQGYVGTSVNLSDRSGVIIGVYPASPKTTVNPTGSYYATAEEADDLVYEGYETPPAESEGDCDRRTNNSVHQTWPFGLVEEQHEPQSGDAGKTQNTMYAAFWDGSRGASCHVGFVGTLGVVPTCDDEVEDALGTRYWPMDLGVNAVREGGGVAALEAWTGSGTTTASAQLVAGDLQPSPAQYTTFYTRVNESLIAQLGLRLPVTSSGIYGADNCGTAIGPGQPKINGWQCDPAKWYVNAAGASSMPHYSDTLKRVALGHRVGEPYTIRDVDCYDGSLGRTTDDEGVRASLVALAGGPCRT